MLTCNSFIQQGKALPERVRHEIVEKWLNGTGIREIGRQMNIAKSTVGNIIDKFRKTEILMPDYSKI